MIAVFVSAIRPEYQAPTPPTLVCCFGTAGRTGKSKPFENGATMWAVGMGALYPDWIADPPQDIGQALTRTTLSLRNPPKPI